MEPRFDRIIEELVKILPTEPAENEREELSRSIVTILMNL